MHPLRRLALGAYYHADLPRRRLRRRRLEAAGRAPVAILFYHRVADRQPNPWTMTSRQFERQMQWLQSRFDLVSLAEAQQRIRGGTNHRQAVSITFDDGYAENCDFALPLLQQMGIPYTYFVSLDPIVRGTPFPHDAARGESAPPNSVAELRYLAEQGVEIGAHTRTHADLGKATDPKTLHDEVVVASEELQQLVGRPVRYFSFPYGLHDNLHRAAFDLAFETGFEAVCSAYGGYNFPGDDAFHLQRIGVDGELLRLKNWLTLDARKLRSTRRFAYESLQAPPRGVAQAAS